MMQSQPFFGESKPTATENNQDVPPIMASLTKYLENYYPLSSSPDTSDNPPTAHPQPTESTIFTQITDQPTKNQPPQVYRKKYNLIGGKNPEPIERVAGNLVYNNQGNKRPYRVAFEQLLTIIKDNAQVFYENHPRIQQDKETFIQDIVGQSIQTIEQTPEILCSLVLCDLNVPSSHYQLSTIIRNWDETTDGTKNFYTVLKAFSQTNLKEKKAKDQSPIYRVRIHFAEGTELDQGFIATKTGTTEAFDFANKATFIAFRYFLRYLWENLPGVPEEWKTPLSPALSAWIVYIFKFKSRGVSLRQFAVKNNLEYFGNRIVAYANTRNHFYNKQRKQKPVYKNSGQKRNNAPSAPAKNTTSGTDKKENSSTHCNYYNALSEKNSEDVVSTAKDEKNSAGVSITSDDSSKDNDVKPKKLDIELDFNRPNKSTTHWADM